MIFEVIEHNAPLNPSTKARIILQHDNWDDYFEFETFYYVWIVRAGGKLSRIGGIKIGQFNMQEEQRHPNLPNSFEKLDDSFFSLGQDDNYYENLSRLGADLRVNILDSLRDVAYDASLFQRALKEKVTGVSLLRSVSRETVAGQFHRMAHGGARLDKYRFAFKPAKASDEESLSFFVFPESQPPTNIHVLIGRNGVGKTRLLRMMTRCLIDEDIRYGQFIFTGEEGSAGGTFSNLVSVSFSAFDRFGPLPEQKDKSNGLRYSYVGLKQNDKTLQDDAIDEIFDDSEMEMAPSETEPIPPKNPEELADEFVDSVTLCRTGERKTRWRNALRTLESDPIFQQAEVTTLASEAGDASTQKLRYVFKRLSSGHQIVLLTITRLVETVEERTLVLLDEPEGHLHPPLLSAFIRALSDLLINRNGVAIVATHSPVVLQEVPSSCVSIISRSGNLMKVESPAIETFGENVGILTHQVFGLEVTESGFHKLIKDKVAQFTTYAEVLASFDNKLGGEGLAIAQALIAAKKKRDRES